MNNRQEFTLTISSLYWKGQKMFHSTGNKRYLLIPVLNFLYTQEQEVTVIKSRTLGDPSSILFCAFTMHVQPGKFLFFFFFPPPVPRVDPHQIFISTTNMLFYSFFKSLVGKDIVVELKNGLSIFGICTLKGMFGE